MKTLLKHHSQDRPILLVEAHVLDNDGKNMIFVDPKTKEILTKTDSGYTRSDGVTYPVIDGVPCFIPENIRHESEAQRMHYDKVAKTYQKNLLYPHTRAYTEYIDSELREIAIKKPFGFTAELCCGTGESFKLFPEIKNGIGVDISHEMLVQALEERENNSYSFIQADVLSFPCLDNTFDTVLMLGGIHHVPDRSGLFSEVYRVLKPGGRFIFREPLNDFWLWQLLRWIIYRTSPGLDAETERPLREAETVPLLKEKGFTDIVWNPAGLLGFCIFMNSDILIFNRLFQYIPGIASLVRYVARCDKRLLAFDLLKKAGLQVIGCATKPGS